jgi:predicted XRE-type DNA-binding protein
MSLTDRLDPDRPVASLLELSGLTQRELADAMGIGQPAVGNALTREKRGVLVGLDWLTRALEAAGRKIDIRAPKNRR